MMEKRHLHWVNLWNANCDSDNPRTKRELLKELDSWERSQFAPNPNSATLMRKDFDGDKWSKGHNDQFKDLIAQARKQNQSKLHNTVDKPKEDSVVNGAPDSSKSSEDSGNPVKEMFKFAAGQVGQVPEESTDDDSLYRDRTPPRGKSSSSGLPKPSGKNLPMFEVPSEPFKDADLSK
jgi:E3 ubiquitin-protein ligase RAD18